LQAGQSPVASQIQPPQENSNNVKTYPQEPSSQTTMNNSRSLAQRQMPVTNGSTLPVPQQQQQQQQSAQQQAMPQTQSLPPNTLGVLRETPQGNVVTPPSQNPTMMYDQAFSLLRNGEYEQAETALAQFLAAYPQHPLAANAQYWLGETYYVRNDFDKASKAFARGYQTYPDNPKAPDNLLKLALSLSNIGQNDSACATLEQLTTQFQTAPQAVLRKANEEKQRIQCR
jgi:tol-pal system protein YbgF